jgi:hypothetical protein
MSETRIVERNEDMSPIGRLALLLQVDGDVIVVVMADPREFSQTSVEFCQPFSGGGRSPHTLEALKDLAVAMERDNTENPIYHNQSKFTEEDLKRIRDYEESRHKLETLEYENDRLRKILKSKGFEP